MPRVPSTISHEALGRPPVRWPVGLPLFATGAIKFRRRHIELMEQLRAFPDGAHDDGPDALEMAVTASQQSVARWVEAEICGV